MTARKLFFGLNERNGIEARLLDRRDLPMPFFDQPLTPAMPGRTPYENKIVKRWTAEIASTDGFVFVTPEYKATSNPRISRPSKIL